jgi:hypothetical protein
MNPYDPPQEIAQPTTPPLSLRASCWKFARLGAATAFIGMSFLGLLFVGVLLLLAIVKGQVNWTRELFAIGSWTGATVIITGVCALAGALIGAGIHFVRRTPKAGK